MRRRLMRSKIHRAKVTEADLNYEGSIAIDTRLLEAAKLIPYEQVDVYNCNNGQRLHTYVIPGKRGQICLNGAAARLAHPGDIVIIVNYADYEESEIAQHKACVVFVDEENNPRS